MQELDNFVSNPPELIELSVRATTEEAIAGQDEVKVITPKTLKDTIEASGGVGKKNVFRSGGVQGSFTATEPTNTFTVPDMDTTKTVEILYKNLKLVNGTNYGIDETTGVVTLGFELQVGDTIDYEVISTSYRFEDLEGVPTKEELTGPQGPQGEIGPQGPQGPKGDTGVVDEGLIDTKIAALVGSAPETLNTLKEIGDALGNDPNFATTMTAELAKKATKEYVASEISTAISEVDVSGDVATVINERVNNDLTHPLNELMEAVRVSVINNVEAARVDLRAHVTSDTNDVLKPHIDIRTTEINTHVANTGSSVANNVNENVILCKNDVNSNVYIARDSINQHTTTRTDLILNKLNSTSSSVIKSIQYGNVKAAEGALEVTVAHAAVALAKSMVLINGISTSGSTGPGLGTYIKNRTSTSLTIANSKDVAMTSGATITWQVVEFY